MAHRTESCPKCNGIVDVDFGSRWLGELVYSESHACRGCSYRLEVDGEPDREFRRLELDLDGVWILNAQPGAEQLTTTLAIIRRFVPITIAEIAAVKSQLPGRILEGTKAEMERLHHYLKEAGISSSIERQSNGEE